MPQCISTDDREILSITLELTKAVRCCRQDGICCEDISFTQFTILDTIAGCRMLDMSMLSKVLSVDKSTTTRLVAPLIRRKLVEKVKSCKDLRMAKRLHFRVVLQSGRHCLFDGQGKRRTGKEDKHRRYDPVKQ